MLSSSSSKEIGSPVSSLSSDEDEDVVCSVAVLALDSFLFVSMYEVLDSLANIAAVNNTSDIVGKGFGVVGGGMVPLC